MANALKLIAGSQWKKLLSSIDTVLFDCDGVLWVGSADPVPKAPQVIEYLRSLGKRVCFVTNNSSKSREEYQKKFTSLNFAVGKEEIFTSGYASAYYLSQQCGYQGKVYLIGMKGTEQEFGLMGMSCIGVEPAPVEGTLDDWLKEKLDPDVGAVVVGYDSNFSYMKMFRATSYLEKPGCLFVATNEDQRLPTKGDIVIPGTGCFVAAIRHSALRDPVVAGKPGRAMFDCISKSMNLDPSRTLMVGDRLDTDTVFGKSNGMKTLVVLTGISSEESVVNAPANMRPDYYTDSIAELLKAKDDEN